MNQAIMGIRAQFVVIVRAMALRLATVLRWLSVAAIAAGLGFAVADYAHGGELTMHLGLCALLAVGGMIFAESLARFGNYVDENDPAA
jgi:hypothetical protein